MSMDSIVFFTEYRRTCGSFAVKAPSLKTGWLNRFVVAIGTFMPVSSRALRKRLRTASRSAADEPNGTRSSSWKFTPYAPISARRLTDSTGSSGGRVSNPNGSRPVLPTVQSPKVNWCSGRGVYGSVMSVG